MKKLLIICALFLGSVPMVSAQQASTSPEPSPEDYERMIENHFKVEFRKMAYESLDLTKDEITKFDPLYNNYISQKMDIVDRRNKLINEYRDEMNEDDDAAEKEDERADFIENYWETQINEMELKKDYFDRFEDIVSNEKAVGFFLLEEKAQSRMEEINLIGIVPMMIDVRKYGPMKKDKKSHDRKMKMKEDSSMNWNDQDDTSTNAETQKMANETSTWTKKSDEKGKWSSDDTKMKGKSEKKWSSKATATADTKGATSKEKMSKTKDWSSEGNAAYTSTSSTSGLSSYNEWIEKEGNGVSINHRYTSNGLESLVNAIYAVAEEHSINTNAWSSKKDSIMSITKELQRNPSSTDHADIARNAFEITAEMIHAIQTEKGTDKTKGFASQVKSAAHAINPDRLMTSQSNDIYAFFSYANQALQAFSNADEKWKNTSASAQKSNK